MTISSRRTFTAGSLAALASIAVVRGPARAAQFSYRYGSNLSVDHPLNVRMTEMWARVKRETGGRLEVQVFPNSVLGGDTGMLAQLRSGALQFLTIDGGILQSVVPVAAIQGVGFAFKDSAEAFRAMDGPLGAYVRKDISATGIVPFEKMWANGMRQITSSTRPIRSASDLAGFKIRTPPGRLWVDLFKAFGASPTPLNFSELYTALQAKIVDGEENPYAIIELAKLFEVQKYLSVTNHMWSAYWLLGNGDAWNALPADVRAVVERATATYALLQRRDVEVRNMTLAEKLTREGMVLNVADTASFRAQLGDFYRSWRDQFGPTAWSLLEATSGRLG
jgi:tripartite ATP-independent transporter DctP family solute receptor